MEVYTRHDVLSDGTIILDEWNVVYEIGVDQDGLEYLEFFAPKELNKGKRVEFYLEFCRLTGEFPWCWCGRWADRHLVPESDARDCNCREISCENKKHIYEVCDNPDCLWIFTEQEFATCPKCAAGDDSGALCHVCPVYLRLNEDADLSRDGKDTCP